MPKTLIKSSLHSNKHKPKIKQETNNTMSNLPPNLHRFKQKLLLGKSFASIKGAWKIFNYWIMNHLIIVL